MNALPAIAALCGALVLTSVPAEAAGQLARHMTELSGAPQTKTMRGKLRGHDTADYTIRLRQGQSLTVTLKTNLRSNYFNVSGPGEGDALFVGARDGARYSAKVAQDGDYKISVYLMANAARRDERANFTLKIAVKD
ncbi:MULTISPECIES: hypothetical protein [unclassified Duganella]|uniref:hypothetical protein n=1 Tax=unclassified Duganella TaxID=2636909 RepID=UPI00088F78C9|nr:MULTISPECIES: hypothetical protein [unclassified Duganella]SDF56773.1 hypothetical protein SAMN05216320_101596 [Duganella sp. OV458]SDI71432.1 hypothetical protein SAMN05428973_101820 [Duganella sp. OV510]